MSDPESISSGKGIPNWMTSRIETNDMDGIAFSPPSHDESFFYIRYPAKLSSLSEHSAKAGIDQITNMLDVAKETQQKNQFVDFANHTEPCKRFLHSQDINLVSPEAMKNPSKSYGTDDGFKGSGAACGSSIVKVAQQMVSSKSFSSHGFQLAQLDQDFDVDNPVYAKTIEDQQLQSSKLIHSYLNDASEPTRLFQANSRLMVRRGSKSLPASPLGSPKSVRKSQQNPYFSGVLPSGTKDGRGWFLSSLLGIQQEAVSAKLVSQIHEETEDVLLTSSNATPNATESIKDINQKILKAKPSELREMNFWSPTSM